MPGIQRENKPSSAVVQQGLADCKKPLQTFHELCRSSFGPRGKIKFVQNCVGGNLTVTSTAKRLFSAMSIHNPILQVFTSTLQSHVGTCGDGGMFYASLASGLVLKGIQSGIRPNIISEIFETLLTLSLDFVNSEACMYRYPVNFADVSFMSSFVKSILGTKPLCRLNSEGQKHLTSLVLECFLNSVSENDTCAPSDNVYVTTDYAETVNHSKTYPGMLLAAPELSKYKPTTLTLHRVNVDCSSGFCHCCLHHLPCAMHVNNESGRGYESGRVNEGGRANESWRVNEGGCANESGRVNECGGANKSGRSNESGRGIKVALISASLSGDLEEVGDVRLGVEGDMDVDGAVLDHLARVYKGLVGAGVGAVLAQKVVHPRLKRQLHASNILVLHRIGLQPLRYIAKLSGATPISCLDAAIPEFQYGMLDDIEHTIVNNKSYVHLVKGGNPVNTLMLTHQQEQPLNEIKEVASAALVGLDQLLQQPYVLCGGGCWQAGLVAHISHKVASDGAVLADKLEVSRRTLLEACHLFTGTVLESTVQPGEQLLFNTTNGHLFYTASDLETSRCRPTIGAGCCCGMMSLGSDDSLTELSIGSRESLLPMDSSVRLPAPDDLDEPSTGIPHVKREGDKSAMVWDSLSVRLNALKMAVLSASAVLRIGQVMNTG